MNVRPEDLRRRNALAIRRHLEIAKRMGNRVGRLVNHELPLKSEHQAIEPATNAKKAYLVAGF
jgi:hypothetical protein